MNTEEGSRLQQLEEHALQVKHGNPHPGSLVGEDAIARVDQVLLDLSDALADAARQATEKSLRDSLTGMPNRALFLDRLNRAIANARRSGQTLGVIYVDLDRFKRVNDSLGHRIGDELLLDISRRLQTCLRDSDSVARLAADEFAILLAGIAKAEDATTVVEKLRASLSEPWQHENHSLNISGSYGIALFPTDAEDPEELIHHADLAQQRAKLQCPDSYQFYAPSMNESALAKLELEMLLRQAIANNELELYYQPQVDISTGEIRGVEALMRWRSPKLGPISPGVFIPLAEETGLITSLGEWAFKTACQQCKEWTDAGFPIRMGVNLSARQFRQADLVAIIGRTLVETGVNPFDIELEITETAAMDNLSRGTLDELRDLGVRISLDDFGTGYCSLGYIKHIPFDTLKIDQSFVRDLPGTAESKAIVATLITLAQSLERRVIAEGVETEAQLEFLHSQSCHERQGYLFSPPIPAEQLTSLFEQIKGGEA